MRHFICLAFSLVSFFCAGQTLKHPFYFSWGYNKEGYADNNIRISQPELQNDYTLVKVRGIDKPGWNTGIFNKDLTIPQYNYRLGYRVNSLWGVELNFDHTKYQVPDQTLRMKGKLNGREVDSSFARTDSNFTYQLNNGANFFLFNAVRRITILNSDSAKVNIRFIAKAGIGFMYPHVENTILGKDNVPHFQFGGFDAGAELDLQFNFLNTFYIEYGIKTLYASYRHLRIYQGTVKQNLSCAEMILSAGVWF
ncbi:MAG: hypothetical protein HY063_10185 [Bacteroidetes bacterium]|nr:hypothetical protein [Bacteroidota bacterium]